MANDSDERPEPRSTTSPTTRIRREAHRQSHEVADLHAILDEALIAHVGVVVDGWPRVLPFAIARDGSSLLLHGSTGSGLLRAGASMPVCVAVTHLDGLLYARSAFESSMRYRSAVIYGLAEPVPANGKAAALKVITDHLFAGRSAELRASTAKEIAATSVLRVSLETASVKVASDGPIADPDDPEPREVWAGIVGLRTVALAPVDLDDVPAGVAVAASALRLQARVNSSENSEGSST